MFPYSIVIGNYYSGDARYLVVNDYSMLQIIIGYKLVVDYGRHGCRFLQTVLDLCHYLIDRLPRVHQRT